MPLEEVESGNLASLLKQFQGRKILVVGDLMVIRFVEVAARKLAREAPVPAGDFVGETFLPGGAANLSRELVSLGATVSVVGMAGSDDPGNWLKSVFSKNGTKYNGVLTDPNRPTPLRTWIMVNNFHMLRIDREDRRDVSSEFSRRLLQEAVPQVQNADCVIISDYDRGTVTSSVINGVVDAAHASGKIVVGQPKMHHYLDFSGVTYVKSNLDEAAHATGMSIVNETSLRNMAVNLLSRLDSKALLVTRGDLGITLFDKDNLTHYPPMGGKKNLFSKVGVRDAMTGAFALAVAAGGDAAQASLLSMLAGEARSGLPRTASLSIQDLEGRVASSAEFAKKIVRAPVRR